ncbi:MAG: hypothetical protein IKD85_02055 [Firmicutes bacterium]|nr:hypothetical protein [Bacillota bacterium]
MRERPKIKRGTFVFADGPRKNDRTATYYYTDEYFRRNAAILNPHLRTMSFALCMACFPSMESEDYERVYRNAETLLVDDLGFSDFEANEDYKKKPAVNTLGMLLAHKVIQDRGEDYSLIVMGLRGAGYGDEWGSNLVLGETGSAQGFEKCMEYADAFLCSYLEKMEDKLCRRVKYWITGYSRVGGVSNLLGARIDRYAPAYRTETGNIFVYTFEAPAAASKEDRRPYPSIHNTVNPHDIVPKLAPSVWGFRRYGVDDTVFPDIHSEEFNKKIPEVLERLHELNPELVYDPSAFRTAYRKGKQILPVAEVKEKHGKHFDEWWYHAKQDEYLERFMDFIGKRISHPEDGDDPTDRERRLRFAKTYQSAFSAFARTYLGGTEKEREAMISVVMQIYKKDLPTRRLAYILFRLWQNTEMSCRRLENYLKGIIRKRIAENPATGLTAGRVNAFFDAVENLAYYVIKCCSYDVRRHKFSYVSTLLYNIKHIAMGHYPEVIMAWLQTMDSYYHDDMSARLE